MNNYSKPIVLTLTAIILLVLTLINVSLVSSNHTMVSETGCCSISYTKVNDDSYLMTWVDNTTLDVEYTELIEVEYPDADYSFTEQLQYELDWTLSEFKELCFTHHGGTY
jgi:hypothetical protein